MNKEFLTILQNTLPVLLTIFVVVFFLIIITRIVLTFLLNKAYKRYLALKKTSKKLLSLKKKKFDKEDEELMRKKSEIPRAHSAVKAELRAKGGQKESGSYEIISSPEQEIDRQEINKINIVDIAKPVGFWTAMILGQKLTYLIQSAQVLNQRGDKGFWASMIEAKKNEAGRQHSRTH
jgi:hypothetical protein